MLHKAMQNEWSRIAIAVFATFLYALGVNLFIVPVGLYSGGMVGLSQVIRTVLAQRVALPAGVDIAGNRGEKVVASAPGKVVYSGRKGSYGLTIDIDAGKGVTLRYAHLDKLGVRKGQKVKQGQYIGNLGRTGRVTGPHLHFEVRLRDKPINPMQFLTHEHQWASNTGTKQRKRSGNL